MKEAYRLFSGFSLAALSIICCTANADPRELTERSEIQHELRRPAIRGAIVYKTYCILCHGEKGDGHGRASKLFDAELLTIKSRPADYYENIIMKGGAASPCAGAFHALRLSLQRGNSYPEALPG